MHDVGKRVYTKLREEKSDNNLDFIFVALVFSVVYFLGNHSLVIDFFVSRLQFLR